MRRFLSLRAGELLGFADTLNGSAPALNMKLDVFVFPRSYIMFVPHLKKTRPSLRLLPQRMRLFLSLRVSRVDAPGFAFLTSIVLTFSKISYAPGHDTSTRRSPSGALLSASSS